jgi:3-methyladenine DNA glycosylase/8-oxoguanine DNA glycosylase
MFDLDKDIFLAEDYWIRKRLSEIVNSAKILSIKECNTLSNQWAGYRTDVSKFLWRIRPEGCIALRNNIDLCREHFL